MPAIHTFRLYFVGAELMVSTSQLSIFVRRWKPSVYEFGPFEEIILNQQTLEELKEKVRM